MRSRLSCVCLALALLLFCQPLMAAKITDIVVKKAEGVTQIFIYGDDILNYTDYVLTKPDRLVLDVKGAAFAFGNKTYALNRGGITTVSTTQFDREGGIARIVIEMGTKPSYLTMQEENDLIVALTTKDTSPFAEWKASSGGVEVAAASPPPAPPLPGTPPPVEERPSAPSAPMTATPTVPAPAPIVEERPAAPSAPATATPSQPAPSPVVEERPVTPSAPVTTPSRPTPPPVIEERPATAAAQPAPTASYVESPRPSYRAASSAPRGLAGGGLVSMDLENADIVTVLRAMAQYSKRNLIIGVDVKGSVSMSLHNVSWARAFEELVRAAGLSYAEESGIIRVGTAAKMMEEIRNRAQSQDLLTQVYKIEYAIASELTGSLTKLLSERGSVVIDARSNSLVITDVSYKQDEVLQLIRILDTPTPQVEIMARIVDIDMDASKDLGINWSVSNVADYDYNASMKKIEVPQLLPSSDRPSVQVGTIRSFAKLDATITALESNRKANTISNPRITAVNNKEAKIVGGKKIPISLRDQSGNAVTQLYTIGMILTTTPHINSANNITLEVKTEISDIDPTSSALGGIVILTNEATTQIVLNDGETAVIGGLVQTKSGKSMKGIPFLMNIPFIGALFRTTTTSTAKREILIFLTPHLLRNP